MAASARRAAAGGQRCGHIDRIGYQADQVRILT
jgi:hypothetical protein